MKVEPHVSPPSPLPRRVELQIPGSEQNRPDAVIAPCQSREGGRQVPAN